MPAAVGQKTMKEHIHLEPGADSNVLPWTFTIVAEGTMRCGNREFLYIIGDALVGSSCVGIGRLRFIQVPGFIEKRCFRTNECGRPVSAVSPVGDDRSRTEIQNVLAVKFPGIQVCFE